MSGPEGGPVRRAVGSTGRVLDGLRHRTVPRRIIASLTVIMLLVGIGMVSYPFATNMFADIKQGKLEDEFTSESLRRAYRARTVPVGSALTRLVIPKLGVDTIVVEGTTVSALRAGAGHYPDTPLPCDPGNVAIAGHRTTYSKPFADIDRLRPGDQIILHTPLGKCWYKVAREPWVTDPYDWSVARNLKGSYLTLTTCHPRGSAAQRLVLRGELVKSQVPSLPGKLRQGPDKESGKLPGPA